MNANSIFSNGIFKQGFGFSPKMLMKDSSVTIEAKAIYAYLASYSGSGMSSFPSVELICHELGISRQRYARHRKQLIDKGYITIQQERTDNGFSKNIYTLNVEIEEELGLQNVTSQNVTTQNVTTQNITSNSNSLNSNNSNSNNTKPRFSLKKELDDLGVDPEASATWLEVRKRKKQVNSKLAFDRFLREVSKTDMTINDAVLMCAEKSWGSFSARWLDNSSSKHNAAVTIQHGQQQSFIDKHTDRSWAGE